MHHPDREAIVRCPECRRHFCRECVAEHDDRMLCADCLRKLQPKEPSVRTTFSGLRRLACCIAGVLLAWFFFYLVGEVLLSIPNTFHEGTLWSTTGLDDQ